MQFVVVEFCSSYWRRHHHPVLLSSVAGAFLRRWFSTSHIRVIRLTTMSATVTNWSITIVVALLLLAVDRHYITATDNYTVLVGKSAHSVSPSRALLFAIFSYLPVSGEASLFGRFCLLRCRNVCSHWLQHCMQTVATIFMKFQNRGVNGSGFMPLNLSGDSTLQ